VFGSQCRNQECFQAGVPFEDVYEFAEENNITVVGGYHQTIAASGGFVQILYGRKRPADPKPRIRWVQAGGHSILSPIYGLGIDRVVGIVFSYSVLFESSSQSVASIQDRYFRRSRQNCKQIPEPGSLLGPARRCWIDIWCSPRIVYAC